MNHKAYIQHVLRVNGACGCWRCDAYRRSHGDATPAPGAAPMDLIRRAVFEVMAKEAGAATPGA